MTIPQSRHAILSTLLSTLLSTPPPSVLLSTHSPAARKVGTQQLIPRGLVCESRLSKAPPAGAQTQGQGGLGVPGGPGGLDPSKRALRVRSMVESGAFFSTGGGGEEGGAEADSLGALKRGLRSTSYRRAVVTGVDLDAPGLDLVTSDPLTPHPFPPSGKHSGTTLL